MAVSDEIILTGGKDTKVRVWLTADALCHSVHPCRHFHEFGEAQMEITQVLISPISNQRVYAGSLDKTCRVYDVPSKCLLKQIQTASAILLMRVDLPETYLYLACDNLNIYQVPIKEPNQKKTLTHRKRVTALTLSTDGTRLISGDAQGLIYVWLLSSEDIPLKTFELHKDKGAVTNLVAVERPLSLFGLTANMSAYDPSSIKPLQRQVTP